MHHMLRLLLMVGIGWQSQTACAHRLNMATSDIVWQAEHRSLEVTHSLHLDDALTLLARLGVPDGVLDLSASARLMHYLSNCFALETKREPIALEPFGAHIDGGMLYIYQRATLATLPTALEITNTILHDVVADAQNQVNWRVGDIVRSRGTDTDQPVFWLTLEKR